MKKRCIYCLDYFDSITNDHVFPKSWYLRSVPKNIEKWKVPSCARCNNIYSKLEEELLTPLGLCMNTDNNDEKDIQRNILRSITPEHGKNSKDIASRTKKRKKLLADISFFKEIPSYGILPNFGPTTKILLPEYPTIRINPISLKKFGEKLTKGFTYIFYKLFIKKTDKIQIIIPQNININFVKELFQKFAYKHNNLGNSIIIERVKAEDNTEINILYYFNIWKKLQIYSHVKKFK